MIVLNYCQDNEISISNRPVGAIQITSAFIYIPSRNYSPFLHQKYHATLSWSQLSPGLVLGAELLLSALGYCCCAFEQALKDICNSWCTRLSSEGHGIHQINYLWLLIMSNKSSLHQGCSCSGDNHTQRWLSMEIKVLLQKVSFSARTEATDNSNATRKAGATRVMRPGAQTVKPARWWWHLIQPCDKSGLQHSPSNERCFSHLQLVLRWGCCGNLSFGWPLTMPSPQSAFLSKKLRAASSFAGC